ncbi:glycine zipper 2TM domain-containing protein [Massilia arenosa]|uniref:Glycine zipper 2TM domain-containing protein n=1 Tax=Zemynaea arenosa TaxID=2561931 RepID=A0A4Y9RXY1_9BURK|nr:glycine zipper 2TM domain-containing protein [Massilia arenosa]TFW13812.1 glycine zipper 2TM domain-containing protein [Massilia arenosa]
MNVQSKLVLSALCLSALPLAQAQVGDFEDFGRVTRVQPRVEQVNRPRQECRTEYVQVPVRQAPPQRSAGGSIIGGIAGAIIGNQVGGGNGRAAATAAGAIAGAVVGDRVDNQGQNYAPGPDRVQEQAVRQCRTVDAWESRTVGYDVTYDYRGHQYTVPMSYDPGQRVKLRVTVQPEQM